MKSSSNRSLAGDHHPWYKLSKMGWKQWNMVSQYVLGIEKWNQIFHDCSYLNDRISGQTIDRLKNLSISDQEITDIENQIGVEIKDLCKANRPLISFFNLLISSKDPS